MNTPPPDDDPLWQAAWSWVLRSHEAPLTDAERAERLAWIDADPAHRRAHDEAARLWLIAGFVPPSRGRRDDGDND